MAIAPAAEGTKCGKRTTRGSSVTLLAQEIAPPKCNPRVPRLAEPVTTWKLCWDCPDGLLPFHVKPIPEPACEVVEFLPDDVKSGEVWDGEICPRWCMEEVPVSQTETESGPVDVRECVLDKNL